MAGRRPGAGTMVVCVLALSLLAAAWSSPAGAATPGKRGHGVAAPKIKWDPIPYGHGRKRQMAAYSERHYGKRTWRLSDPKAIVLHFTASSTFESAFNVFASNAPNLGEKPGVCSQFVVDKDGTVHQLTRLYVRCRHTVGLNHVAIGIEMVQEDLGSSHASDQAILHRGAQVRAATRLVAWLKQRYRIDMSDVIGHSMANDSPLFKDLEGWRNDHTDWLKRDVKDFRKKVAKLIHKHGRPAAERGAGLGARLAFGHSVSGRKLVARRLGPADAKRVALVVGEVHGDEEAGRSVVRELRRHRRKLHDAAIWTVSTVNPDGHADDRRTNDRGVDLNRNFPVGWDGSAPPGSGDYAGPRPLSEPESRGLRDLIRRIDPDLAVFYHQPWGAVLAPCDGRIPLEKRYADVAGMEVDRCRGEKLPGTMTRWVRKRGATAFVVEFGPGSLSDSQVERNARALREIAVG